LLLLSALPARAQYANARGWCEDGNQNVITSGLTSSTTEQGSFPQCTISVSIHGGGPATIYSTGAGGSLTNPFTAGTNGQWLFYAANGEYDITMTGAGFPSPVTYSDVFVGSVAPSGGVSSINSITGAVTVTGSGGTTVTTLGNTITISSVSGGGCTLPGNDTAVLTEHPAGTCYDSADFTWDDTNYNLQAGNGNTIISGDAYDVILGSGNSVAGSNDYLLGHDNDLPTECDNCFVVGETNQSSVSPSNTPSDDWLIGQNILAGAATTNMYALGDTLQATAEGTNSGPTFLTMIGNFDYADAGTSGVISQDYILGDTDYMTAGGGGTISSSFIIGETNNMITSAAGRMDADLIMGFVNNVSLALAEPNELDSVVIVGSVNNVSGKMSLSSIFGNNSTLTGCSDCYLYGENGSLSADNTLGIGLSNTPELVVTPGAILFNGTVAAPYLTSGLTIANSICSDSAGNLTPAAGVNCFSGGGGYPTLDEVLDPVASKTFALGGYNLEFVDAVGTSNLYMTFGQSVNFTYGSGYGFYLNPSNFSSPATGSGAGDFGFQFYSSNGQDTTGSGTWGGYGGPGIFNLGNGGSGASGTNAEGGAGGWFWFQTGVGGDSSGTAANSSGGQFFIQLGAAGTGGSGAVGTDGIFSVQSADYLSSIELRTGHIITTSPDLQLWGAVGVGNSAASGFDLDVTNAATNGGTSHFAGAMTVGEIVGPLGIGTSAGGYDFDVTSSATNGGTEHVTGNLTNDTLTDKALVYSVGGVLTPLDSPTTNGNYLVNYNVTGSAAVAPTVRLPGLNGRPVTGTTSTDTVLYSDNNQTIEYTGSVAVATELPNPATLLNGYFYTVIDNLTTGSSTAVTVTPDTTPASFTINGATASIIPQYSRCVISVDQSSDATPGDTTTATNWLCVCTVVTLPTNGS
jgi:hypothetical protein